MKWTGEHVGQVSVPALAKHGCNAVATALQEQMPSILPR